MSAEPHHTHRPWLEARNLLVVRLDHLGDVVMTTPAIAAIRHSSPDARITLLTSTAGAAALKHIPVLDDAIVYDAPWTQGKDAEPVAGRAAAADRRVVNELLRRQFDAAIVFTVCTQSA